MPIDLPDIDEEDWLGHARNQLGRQIDERIGGFGLEHAINEKIAGLQGLVGQQNAEPPPSPPPPPDPAPPPPQPEPLPVPEPEPAAVEPSPSPGVGFETPAAPPLVSSRTATPSR